MVPLEVWLLPRVATLALITGKQKQSEQQNKIWVELFHCTR